MNLKRTFAALVLAFSISTSYANAQASPPASPSTDLKRVQPSLAVGSKAPNFALQSLTGETVHLSDFRGKVVLLNFWATWCGPCKILTPWLVDFQNEYGAQGLVIVGITLDDASKEEIAEFVDSMRVNYTILIGNEKVAEAYGGIPSMPATFFVGHDGKITSRIIRLPNKNEIEESIKKAMEPQTENPEAAATSAPSP